MEKADLLNIEKGLCRAYKYLFLGGFLTIFVYIMAYVMISVLGESFEQTGLADYFRPFIIIFIGIGCLCQMALGVVEGTLSKRDS